MSELEKAINDLGEVSMIIIDPLSAYLAGVDTYNNKDVRSLLAPLTKLAGRYDIEIIGVEHPPKSSNGRAMNQVGGSIAFVAASRSAYLVSKDPEDEERRLFLKIKNNLSNYCGGISFTVESHKLHNGIKISKVVWGDEPVKITADEVLDFYDRTEWQKGKDIRADWLNEYLADGPKKVTDVLEEAQKQGIGKKQLKNLREEMEIESNKTDFKGGWEISLPDSKNIQEPEGAQDDL